MANYINNDLFETVYTDPSGQDWKLKLSSLIPQYTGQPLGQGASPLSASTGYVVRWTWSNENDPETGGNYPGTTHIQVDDATGAPFTSYANAEAYTLTTAFTTNTLIDQTTVSIVAANDSSVPQNWYYYNLDMAFPGLTMRWESDADDPNKAIMGSGAEMSVYVDDAQEAIITQAVIGAELNLCLDVYKKDDDGDYVDWWHGIALPESISFEIREGKRLLDLSFSCGLALLNDIDWKEEDGSKKTGQLSLKQTILQSLRKLPHFNNFTFHRPEVSLDLTDHTTATPKIAVGLKTIVPGYTGILARVTNDVTLATFHDLTASDNLADYDGWKVLYLYDQYNGGAALYNFAYADMPSVDATAGGMRFNGSNEYLQSANTTIFSGDREKCIFVSIDPDVDSPSAAIFAQGNSSLETGAGKVYHLQVEDDQFTHRFDGSFEAYGTTTDATLSNQVLVSKTAVPGGTTATWQLFSNGTELATTSSSGTTANFDTVSDTAYFGARPGGAGNVLGNFYNGVVHAAIIYNDDIPSLTEERSIETDLIDMFQNGVEPQAAVKGGWALSTYGTPMPVTEDYDTWDPTVHDPLGSMFCQAETFNEPKEKYDRKFEMRPDPAFISTGHVLEDICKALGMNIVQWEGGWHLFSAPYLHKTTKQYLDFPDVDAAPHAWRYTWNITDGAQESAYEQVPTDIEYEDFAAPQQGLVKTFALPYKGVKLTHEKTPSDILIGYYEPKDREVSGSAFSLSTYHKLAPQHTGSPVNPSYSDLKKYGDARLGYVGNKQVNRTRRRGMLWTMTGAYYQDGYPYDANGGGQGSDLSPRAQHKRLEDGVTGGGPNSSFYDGRYLGPDSAEIGSIDLEAGETLNLEMGAYVENGRLDEHIGQTYIFHHRVEVRQDDGTKYRLRRHVITQDTWTDNGTERKTEIDGSNSDVDRGWAGDRDYYIKEYDSLAWVKEADVTADEWEDCWYEVMSFHPETTKTEGDDLAETNLTALPYYGNAPMGTEYKEQDDKLVVKKENRFAYVKEDLAVELPGIEGTDEFTTLYTECGISCYGPTQGLRPVHGFAGQNPDFASRKADGSSRKRHDGIGLTPEGSTIDMPYVMGWNKWVIRYGDQGEKNSLNSYADGGAGVRMYDAGSSRLGSRFVFNSPEYKGRIKVQHWDGSAFTDKTFNTQWRPQNHKDALTMFNSSLHEQVTYEALDLVGYVRPRYEGSWVKHPGTAQGGCPAPFLPHVARCLDPDNAIAITPYRMRWTFAQGFQMEGVEVGEAYEKERIVLETGDVATGSSGGGSSATLTRLGAIGAQAGQVALRPQFEVVGSNDTSVGGGTSASFGPYNFMNGTNDGTGIFYEELWGTNPNYIDGSSGYSQRFDLVDSTNVGLYGGGNLGRMVVQEPGLYMIELKGMLDNGTPSGTSNTYGFAMHRLGTVSNNTYTGDTSPKTSNIIENIASETGSTGTGSYLKGVWTEQVSLGRGDVITFSAYGTASAVGTYIYTGDEELKIRLVKLTEQVG